MKHIITFSLGVTFGIFVTLARLYYDVLSKPVEPTPTDEDIDAWVDGVVERVKKRVDDTPAMTAGEFSQKLHTEAEVFRAITQPVIRQRRDWGLVDYDYLHEIVDSLDKTQPVYVGNDDIGGM